MSDNCTCNPERPNKDVHLPNCPASDGGNIMPMSAVPLEAQETVEALQHMSERFAKMTDGEFRVYARSCLADGPFQGMNSVEKGEMVKRGYATREGTGINTVWCLSNEGHKIAREASGLRAEVKPEGVIQITMTPDQAKHIRQALAMAAAGHPQKYGNLLDVCKHIDELVKSAKSGQEGLDAKRQARVDPPVGD